MRQVNLAIELSKSSVLEHAASHLMAAKRRDQSVAFEELKTLASLLEQVRAQRTNHQCLKGAGLTNN